MVPQMAPMNWLGLFIMFIAIFLLFNSINYFCFLYPPKSSSMILKTHKINWKW
uniref:ATP synthase complex subunit 8 n=1 Tax=Staphylinidae sp. BMNH 1274232 TaxID=1796565 RepID=A0A126TET6_9COLE|nr:ATP synthase F0 subunit 8 [Staphylinidae sp. BMNH 1274232]